MLEEKESAGVTRVKLLGSFTEEEKMRESCLEFRGVRRKKKESLSKEIPLDTGELAQQKDSRVIVGRGPCVCVVRCSGAARRVGAVTRERARTCRALTRKLRTASDKEARVWNRLNLKAVLLRSYTGASVR